MKEADAGLLEAMDDVLLLSMLLKGTTPQLTAAEWERQYREGELQSQEHSCKKVQQWLKSVSEIMKHISKVNELNSGSCGSGKCHHCRKYCLVLASLPLEYTISIISELKTSGKL